MKGKFLCYCGIIVCLWPEISHSTFRSTQSSFMMRNSCIAHSDCKKYRCSATLFWHKHDWWIARILLNHLIVMIIYLHPKSSSSSNESNWEASFCLIYACTEKLSDKVTANRGKKIVSFLSLVITKTRVIFIECKHSIFKWQRSCRCVATEFDNDNYNNKI